MKREDRDKWVAALRSGEYVQTQGLLRRDEPDGDGNPAGYCCLGVGVDVLDLARWDGETYWFAVEDYERQGSNEEAEWPTWLQMETNLNTPVENLAHLCPVQNRQLLPRAMQDGDMVAIHDQLASLNDQGLNFEQIADVIEAHVPVED